MKYLFLLAIFALGYAFAGDAVLGLNFSNTTSGARISGGTADGFNSWVDSRGVSDGANAAVQTTPLALGSSGVSATWSSSNVWSAGGAEQQGAVALPGLSR